MWDGKDNYLYDIEIKGSGIASDKLMSDTRTTPNKKVPSMLDKVKRLYSDKLDFDDPFLLFDAQDSIAQGDEILKSDLHALANAVKASNIKKNELLSDHNLAVVARAIRKATGTRMTNADMIVGLRNVYEYLYDNSPTDSVDWDTFIDKAIFVASQIYSETAKAVEAIKEKATHSLDVSAQLKSADLVTYDDNGEIIPPSERFNPKKPDIRFSVDVDKKIINTLIGEEISIGAYDILSRLEKGLYVNEEEIEALPEIEHARDHIRKLEEKYLKKYPYAWQEGAFSTNMIDSFERRMQRQRIIEERVNSGSITGFDKNRNEIYSGNVRKDRRIDIITGLPASGKSTSLVNPISEFYESQVIDSDIVKQMLTPEFNDGWGAGMVHSESSDINIAILKRCLEKGNNIVLPIVGANEASVVAYLKMAKGYGYDTHVHLNVLDNSIATGRVLLRFFEKGRFVDYTLVTKKGDKPISVFNNITERDDVDGFTRWNNDVGVDERPNIEEFSRTERDFTEKIRAWRKDRTGSNREDFERIRNEERKSYDVDSFAESVMEIDEEVQQYESDLAKILNEAYDFKGDFAGNAINKVAKSIKIQYGATIKTSVLEDSLLKVFIYLRDTGSVTMDDIEMIRNDIAVPIVDSIKGEQSEYEVKSYKEFIANVSACCA